MRYPCLVLDHDDTVVKSTAQIHYPAFLHTLAILRPTATISLTEFTEACADPGFLPLCTEKYGFTKEELDFELQDWLTFVKGKIPDAHAGFAALLSAYKQAGGMIYVVSHSEESLIVRDYKHHFGLVPDAIYDLSFTPQKPDPAPLLDIMKQTGLTERELLVVDDLPAGKQMADAAGVDFIYAGWCQTAPSVHKQMVERCQHTLYHPQELAELLAI